MQQSVANSMLVDWSVLTSRWLFIFGMSVWLAYHMSNDMAIAVLVLVIVAVLLNLSATAVVLFNSSLPFFRLGSVALDFIIVNLALAIAGNGLSLGWAALLPVISAALYFGWAGALALSLLGGLLGAGVEYLFEPGRLPLTPLVMAGISLVVGVGIAVGLRQAGGTPSVRLGRKDNRKTAELDQKERERRSSIFEMISALNASLNYQQVLENSLDLSAKALKEQNVPEVERLVSAVLLFSESDKATPELRVATSRNMEFPERDAALPGASGLLAKAIDEGASELTRAAGSDPELSSLSSFRESKAAYGIPLRTGLDAYGLLLFAHPNPDFFTPERREVLDIVGKQSVVAIQNARLYQDLEQEKNRLMQVQEESRKKLARDLHDGPTQSVSAIAMRVNFARRLMERDIKAASDELFKIEDLARRTTKEIRHMLFTLRPLVLESQGLVAAWESMAAKMKETFEQNVIIQADPRAVEAIESSKQAVVFYIAEEAVNNARKHAQAGHIWVRLKLLRDNYCLLEVEDDGQGFDVNAVGASYENRGSLGMVNLRERTTLVSGVLRIDSAKGKGTRVQVVIPLTEEAADRIHRSA
ncbi:MAG: histidine kinase [Chloroflexota bacterium]